MPRATRSRQRALTLQGALSLGSLTLFVAAAFAAGSPSAAPADAAVFVRLQRFQAETTPQPVDSPSAPAAQSSAPAVASAGPVVASPEVSATGSVSPGESPSPIQSLAPPSPIPVQISPANALVVLGHSASVHVLSPPSGIVMLSGFDPAIVRAVFNPIDRTVDLFGLRSGSTTVILTDDYGLTATLAVLVESYAGKAYSTTSITVSGDPASADFVAEEAAQAARLVAYPEAGALVRVDAAEIKAAHELRPDDAETVYAPLSIEGAGYVPYHQTVAVHIVNLAQPNVAPKNLLVSDFPETIVENGTLFYADVNFDAPARLLYYHYSAPRSATRRVLVKAQNNGLDTSLLQLISGIAGPNPNILAVGHDSTKRFLMHEASGEGKIFEVPARATVNVVDQLLPAGTLVSGLMQLRVVSGSGVRVAVVVQDADQTPIEPISDTLLSSAVKHSRGIYQVPQFDYDVSYTVGGDPATLLIGKLPLPNLVEGEVLGGDYGVKQSAAITLLNGEPQAQRVGMWFEPRGGRATGTFLIDGRLVQLHPVEAARPALVRVFTVPAHGYRRVNFVTMPEGGSSYPVRVTLSSDPPPGGSWNISSAVY